MPVRPVIDSSALRELNRQLKEIDPALRRQVGKDIKSAVAPQAEKLRQMLPQAAPVSGMAHNGRTAWRAPRVGVYATPGGGRGSLARMEIYGPGDKRAGVKIADLAGTRNNIKQERGRVLIQALSSRYPLSAGGRGGRFGWAYFIRTRPILIREIEKVLDKFAQITSRKLAG